MVGGRRRLSRGPVRDAAIPFHRWRFALLLVVSWDLLGFVRFRRLERDLRGSNHEPTSPIIQARGLGKRYVLRGRGIARSARPSSTAVDAPLRGITPIGDRGLLGARDVELRHRAGRGGRHHRTATARASRRCSRSCRASPRRRPARSDSRGKVASLLEVGTGFHRELSGRENIFLNGAIMGMTRAEIRARFDEIVAFAEVDQFLDTPVKRYSSRHVRAPGVRRRRPPAAGDPRRRRGAGGGRRLVPEEVPRQDADVASGGRTVLFVSHNMAAISRLCTRGDPAQPGRHRGRRARREGRRHLCRRHERREPDRGRLSSAGQVPLARSTCACWPRASSATNLDRRRSTFASRSRFRSTSRCLSDRYPLHPNIHVFNEEGACVFVTSDGYLQEVSARQKGRASTGRRSPFPATSCRRGCSPSTSPSRRSIR